MVSNQSVDERNITEKQVLINGEILTEGAINLTFESVYSEDNLGIKTQDLTITGLLETPYYVKELNEIESIRYYVNGITVVKEEYSSHDDTILYSFKAEFFQVKFQTSNYERRNKE
jgi:hypothetical protein